MTEPLDQKKYIGDGVYIRFDGFAYWMTTEDGIKSTNVICLEPNVMEGLLEYVKRITGVAKNDR